MAPPVLYNGDLVFVDNGAVYTLPGGRIAGLYAPANGRFTTPSFTIPSANPTLSLNVNASWGRKLVTGGCDEGCAAYVDPPQLFFLFFLSGCDNLALFVAVTFNSLQLCTCQCSLQLVSARLYLPVLVNAREG